MGIADHPSNQDLLDYLRTFAQPATGRREADLDGWELHIHPDLMLRLAEIAGSPRALVPLFGVVAIELKDVVAVVGLGMDTLLLRLPAAPTEVEAGQPVEPLRDRDWYAVSAWQSGLPSAEGLQRLRLLLGAARGPPTVAVCLRDTNGPRADPDTADSVAGRLVEPAVVDQGWST